MQFSVVIPTCNRMDYLPRALESVWAQTLHDYEVIVVDDGSSDGTRGYLASLEPRLKVVCQDNRGPGNARNAGVRQARGDYVVFLDSDDCWWPWTLEIYAQAIRDFHLPAVISGCKFEFEDPRELESQDRVPLDAICHADYFAASRLPLLAGAGMSVYRASVFREAGGFSERNINAEDHDLALRLGEQSRFVSIRAPSTVAYRRHAHSETANSAKTLAGVRYLIEQEVRQAYPGKRRRAWARRTIICRHVRPVSLECLRRGRRRDAWRLYLQTLGWHVRLGRWKYLLGFVLAALAAPIRSPRS